MIVVGILLTGLGIGSFLTPNKIVGGGAAGLSTIFYHTIGLEPGINFLIINATFLLIGLKILGKDFIIKTLICSTLVSGSVQLFSFFPIYTENLILAPLFGSGLAGTGIGMTLAAGSSTGGTDILGRLIQWKFPYLPIGKVLLFVDGAIIFLSFLIFGEIELTLYGIISLLVSSFSIDLVISKLNVSRLAFVITEKGDEIADKLVHTSPRGVTQINVQGMYTNTPKKMLFCALKESEAEVFQAKILEVDPTAFIVFSEAQRIKGNGFHLYK